jgi:hypothetical protein
MEKLTDIWTRRRIEPQSAIMVIVTASALVGSAWLHYRSHPADEPLTVGSRIAPLSVVDLETSEPLVLAGHGGKVVWLTFWSVHSASASSSLKALERATKKLTGHRRFMQVVAAVDDDSKASQIRATLQSSGIDLPVYLAAAATLRRFGTSSADPPLHVLIGGDGRIIALARGGDEATMARLASMAQRRLEEFDPQGTTRFAAARIKTVVQIGKGVNS